MDGDVSAHSQEAEKETTRLWRTFRTVYEMLADRVSLAIAPGHNALITFA